MKLLSVVDKLTRHPTLLGVATGVSISLYSLMYLPEAPSPETITLEQALTATVGICTTTFLIPFASMYVTASLIELLRTHALHLPTRTTPLTDIIHNIRNRRHTTHAQLAQPTTLTHAHFRPRHKPPLHKRVLSRLNAYTYALIHPYLAPEQQEHYFRTQLRRTPHHYLHRINLAELLLDKNPHSEEALYHYAIAALTHRSHGNKYMAHLDYEEKKHAVITQPTLAHHIQLAISAFFLGHVEESYTYWQMVLRESNDPYHTCLAATLYSTVDDPKYAAFVQKTVPQQLFDAFSHLPAENLEECITANDTGNITLRFTEHHPLLRAIYFIKAHTQREPLAQEQAINQTLHNLFIEDPRTFVPLSIGTTEQPLTIHDRKLYLFLQASEEATQLLTLIDEKKTTYRHFERIITALATLHARFPPLPYVTPVDLPHKLAAKLATISLPPELLAQIQDSIAPLLTQLTVLSHVFNKDGHPENYLFTPHDDLVIVDNENRGLVPYPIDIVNLTEHPTQDGTDYLTPEEKHTLDAHYHTVFSSLRPDTIYYDETYTAARTNALLFRGLSNIATWTDPRRQRMRPRRPPLLHNMQRSIEQLAQDYPATFHDNERAYDGMHAALNQLHHFIAS